MEAVVESLHQDWGVGLREFRQVEQDVSFSCIGDRGLLKQDLLASADCTDGPLEMQTVGQLDQDGIDVGIVEDLFRKIRIKFQWYLWSSSSQV